MSKKKKSKVKLISLVVLLILLGSLGVAFLLASMPPEEYNPFLLDDAGQELAANRCATQVLALASEFEKVEPIQHVITEKDMNQYLASLVQIAIFAQGEKGMATESPRVAQAMEKAGIRGPMVKFRDDGTITFMAQSDSTRKIISLDLHLRVNDKRELFVTLTGARIGRLPLPVGLLTGAVKALQGTLGKPAERAAGDKIDASEVVSTLIRAIDDEPLDTTITLSRKKPKALDRLEMRDGTLTLYFVPVKAEKKSEKPL
ncbi:MAG: hypothetical protein HN370_08310 [Phycisphaerales bacterium]|jgi:flagellar basal body-associated protein FliL|nr:hypothetical protein [Phycisphaerales bacterium]